LDLQARDGQKKKVSEDWSILFLILNRGGGLVGRQNDFDCKEKKKKGVPFSVQSMHLLLCCKRDSSRIFV